jgi:AraC-like DNA-binding protein
MVDQPNHHFAGRDSSRFEPQTAECGSVIVVAPPQLVLRISCLMADLDVVAFRDLRELDRWRSGDLVRCETIRCDLEATLREMGRALQELSPAMRRAIEAICHERVVPSVPQLERQWPSRRSFYRAWAAEFSTPPGEFLRRVRTARAERLIGDGATPKEAAIRTGFGSVDRLRRLIAQRRKKSDE